MLDNWVRLHREDIMKFETNAALWLQAPSQSHDYYLWTVRSISNHAKGIENSAHLYCIKRSFSTYCKIVVTERKLEANHAIELTI